MTLPAFDEGALASLTKKIEVGFNQGKTKAKSSAKHHERKNKKTPHDAVTKAPVSSKSTSKLNGDARSRKRDLRGELKKDAPPRSSKKHEDKGHGKVQRNADDEAKKPEDKGHGRVQRDADDEARMLEEILALGGDREDLALMADVGSESEMEVGQDGQGREVAPVDKTLQGELASFVKGLGISKRAPEDATEADAQSEEDEQSEEEEEVEEEPVTPAKLSKPSAPETGANFEPIVQRPTGKASQQAAANRLKFEPRPAWHTVELPVITAAATSTSNPTPELLKSVHDYALFLLNQENEAYSASNLSSSSSNRFLSTIMSSGTLSDKISALTLVVQESPLHTMKAFENLLGLAKKRSRGQAVTALGALKDLLGQGVVLPPERKLRAFRAQPALLNALGQVKPSRWKPGEALPGPIDDVHLIAWAYEDCLKTNYFEMMKILETWCNDEIEYARGRAVQYVWELLKEKPEQEANLMRLLVNKLGDPDKKIASKASHLLLQLQTTHPLMKPIIIASIESELLYKPGQSSHARYYAIITLNQTILSEKEEHVARKLLDIFFGLFVTILKKPSEKPKSKPDDPPVQLNRQGQVQGGGGKAGKKARRKAELEETAKKSDEELNEKLISAVLTGVNRAFPFARTDDTTFEKHVDTLFRITHSSNFNTSIQALLLIQQLSTTKQIVAERFYRTLYESLLDPRLLTSSKQPMYLNLLFRALKADLNVRRVQAFVKRLLQIILLHQPPFVCGTIYLIRELEATFPNLRGLIDQPEQADDDDVETFRDVPDDASDEGMHEARKALVNGASDHTTPAHTRRYDGRKRHPEHSNADKSCLWEIVPFLAHFHPSVTLFADRLLHGEKMPAKPDLSLHTLIHFLDRFVYRNAKSLSAPRGTSIMQPLAGEASRGMMVSDRNASKARAPLNTEGFWRKKQEDVSVDEVFFHQYFNRVGKGGKAKKETKQKKGTRDDDDDSEAEDDKEEDEIWKALVQSRPDVEGSDGGDSELDSLDAEDMASDLDEADADEEMDDGGVPVEGKDLSDDDDGFDLGSDDEAILDSDEDVPSDFESAFRDEEMQNKVEEEKEDESKLSKSQLKSRKRRKLKSLPTFASADDYAEMLGGDDDDDEDEDM